nr:hypothetical protein [Burkholderia sp. 9779_493]
MRLDAMNAIGLGSDHYRRRVAFAKAQVAIKRLFFTHQMIRPTRTLCRDHTRGPARVTNDLSANKSQGCAVMRATVYPLDDDAAGSRLVANFKQVPFHAPHLFSQQAKNYHGGIVRSNQTGTKKSAIRIFAKSSGFTYFS